MIKRGRHRVFIDTGVFNKELLKYAGKGPVILTHSHIDHILGNYLFDKVYCHQDAFKRIMNCDVYDCIIREDFKAINALPKCFRIVENREVISFGRIRLQFFYTSGHSSDSISVYEPNKGWLFTGDTVYEGEFILVKDSSINDLKNSHELLSSLDARIICPAHGGVLNNLPSVDELLANAVSIHDYLFE